jgi:hypothetical protein
MKKAMFLSASFFMLTSVALAQSVPSPGVAAGTSMTCDQYKLSFQDLADCRTQWATATSDADRTRIQNSFAARSNGRGSSTPPVTQNVVPTPTVAPGAGLSTGGISRPGGVTPSLPEGITPQAPGLSAPFRASPSVAPAQSTGSAFTGAPMGSSTAIPAAPSPAIRTPPPPVSGSASP